MNQAKKLNQTKSDGIEWRCDYFEQSSDISVVLDTLKKLRKVCLNQFIIFTFRTIEEGGQKEISQKVYESLLLAVDQLQMADMIDVEYRRSSPSLLKQLQTPTILSYHNFKETSCELTQLFKDMDQCKTDFIKIAVMPQKDEDVERLMNATKWANEHCDSLIISMAMGEIGKKSRLSSDSCLTFASLDQASAPGQLSLDEMIEYFENIYCIEENSSIY